MYLPLLIYSNKVICCTSSQCMHVKYATMQVVIASLHEMPLSFMLFHSREVQPVGKCGSLLATRCLWVCWSATCDAYLASICISMLCIIAD